MFKTNEISKYAYAYMVQPLKEGTHSFCLACIDTNNKITGEDILKRWDYIYQEMSKRGITIVSFSADGDSRLMRAMRVTLSLAHTDDCLALSINKNRCTNTCVPDKLQHWMSMKFLPSVFCVQDIVHLGVKMKSRMLKPSILLPLGSYVVSSAHYSMIVEMYGKERHGLRERDLNHNLRTNKISMLCCT